VDGKRSADEVRLEGRFEAHNEDLGEFVGNFGAEDTNTLERNKVIVANVDGGSDLGDDGVCADGIQALFCGRGE